METELLPIVKMNEIAGRYAFLLIALSSYEEKGFKNCSNVQAIKNELAQIQYDKYKDKYPTYLYFSDEQFNEIVYKNNLVVATAAEYTGNIPDHCWQEIQKEAIEKEDLRNDTYKCKIKISTNDNCYMPTHSTELGCNSISFDFYASEDDVEVLKKIDNISAIRIFAKKLNTTTEDLLIKIHGDYFCNNYINLVNSGDKITIYVQKETFFKNEGLMIAAPDYMIDRSKKKPIGILKEFFKIKPAPVLDPIVFRYIKDGVLVITFWK